MRAGDDLLISYEIPLVDALCGGEVHFAGIDGKPVRFRVNTVQPGSEQTLANLGMPKKDGTRGDLRITYRVKFPHLSDSQKATLKTQLPRH